MRFRGWTIFFAVLLFFSIGLFLTSLQILQLFSAKNAKEIIRISGFYEKMPELLSTALKNNEDKTFEPIVNAVKSSFTPAELQKQTEKNIEQIFVYLNTGSLNLDIKYDLRPIKEKIQILPLAQLDEAFSALKSLPVCPSDQAESENTSDCLPAEFSVEKMGANSPLSYLAQIPDEFRLDQYLIKNNALKGVSDFYHSLRTLLLVSLISMAICLILIFALAQNFIQSIRIIGKTNLYSGLVFVLLFLTNTLLFPFLLRLSLPQINRFQLNILPIAFGGSFFQSVFFYALLFLTGGIILIIVSHLTKEQSLNNNK